MTPSCFAVCSWWRLVASRHLPSPFLEPFPSVRDGARHPLPTLCPPAPRVAYAGGIILGPSKASAVHVQPFAGGRPPRALEGLPETDPGPSVGPFLAHVSHTRPLSFVCANGPGLFGGFVWLCAGGQCARRVSGAKGDHDQTNRSVRAQGHGSRQTDFRWVHAQHKTCEVRLDHERRPFVAVLRGIDSLLPQKFHKPLHGLVRRGVLMGGNGRQGVRQAAEATAVQAAARQCGQVAHAVVAPAVGRAEVE